MPLLKPFCSSNCSRNRQNMKMNLFRSKPITEQKSQSPFGMGQISHQIHLLFVTTLSLLIFLPSCAHSQLPLPPPLSDRELTVDKNGAHFDYILCDKTGLFGNCRHTKIVRDIYNLSDPSQLQTFFDMDFVLMKRPSSPVLPIK